MLGNSLVVRWVGRCAFTAEGMGSIPGQGTKIPQAVQRSKKKKGSVNMELNELTYSKHWAQTEALTEAFLGV